MILPTAFRGAGRKEKGGSPEDARQGDEHMSNIASIATDASRHRQASKAINVGPAVEYVGIIEMSPEEWATILDNPRQRDTASRARRAEHLKTPHPSHCKVNMARLPDGRRYKLDGHTRSFLWQAGDVKVPGLLYVDVWNCRTLEDAKHLYSTFDSRSAVETTSDQVFGAVREEGTEFKSALLSGAKFAFAMRAAYDCLYGNNAAKAISVYDLLKFWRTELDILDGCDPKPHRFHTGVTAAALLTIRRYGTSASLFWNAYSKDHGIKQENFMDAVQAFEFRMQARRVDNAIQGRANYLEIIGIAISAFESYRAGRTYKINSDRAYGIKTTSGNSFREWMIAAKNAKRSV